MSPKVQGRVLTTDAEIEEAVARSRTYIETRPRALSAAYVADEDEFVLAMEGGVRIHIPRASLQFLGSASANELAQVEVDLDGFGLHWELLDVDHYVPALVNGIFGNARWMSELGKRGGASRSDAKVAAARENGKKGGRPKIERKSA
jgi:hypothetical protein